MSGVYVGGRVRMLLYPVVHDQLLCLADVQLEADSNYVVRFSTFLR